MQSFTLPDRSIMSTLSRAQSAIHPNPYYCATCGARTDYPSTHCATLRTSDYSANPNRGKRRPGAHVRPLRTSGKRSTVTVTRVDPAYLARYGSEAAQRAADTAQRTGKPGAGNATVVTRSATRRTLRKLASDAR